MKTPIIDALADRRVAVVLSSAYFGFYAHTGFMKALYRAGIRPIAVGGASSGAMVAAMAATGMQPEEWAGPLLATRRKDFWDPAVPWPVRRRMRRPPGLLKGRKFAELLDAQLPIKRFEDCPIPLLTVSTNLDLKRRHIDLTGPIVPAVHASCALPLLFEPVTRDGHAHVDGGLMDKVPVRAMLDAFEPEALLVHFIPSPGLAGPVPRAPWAMMDHALDLVRNDAWRLQCEIAQARGAQVHIIETRTPLSGPLRMRLGPSIVTEAESQTRSQLYARG
ncbi:MAG: patatin-like phospholipase family protein [Bradymonadia bacterium]